MRAAASHRLRVLPSGRREAPRRHGDPSWLRASLLAVGVVAAAVAIGSGAGAERRALARLSEDQRHALLSRAVEELRQACGDARPPGLEGHCREVAAFASQFDECRGECAALVRHELTPSPTR